jgi:hypothetical protein
MASEKMKLAATGLGGSGGLADDALLPPRAIFAVLWSTTRRITTMSTKYRRFLPVALLLVLLSSWSMPSLAYTNTELFFFMAIQNRWIPAPRFGTPLFAYTMANFQRLDSSNSLFNAYYNALGLYFQYNITTLYVTAVNSGASPAQTQAISNALTQIQTLNSKSPN